jgi:hypothetical protein
MGDDMLALLAFGVFSTALVLVYLLALWVRPRAAWAVVIALVAASITSFVMSEQQAAVSLGENLGLRALVLGAILAIAAIGGLVGAAYGTWKARL